MRLHASCLMPHARCLMPGANEGRRRRAQPASAGGRKRRPSRLSSLLLLFALVSACAGRSLELPPVPAPKAESTEPTGSSSPTQCDAWFNINGSFEFGLNDLRLTLSNRSLRSTCAATRVTWRFEGPVTLAEVSATAPPTWTVGSLPCGDGGDVCGIDWRATDAGVLPGQDLAGFGLRYNPLTTARPKSWTVAVGRRFVEMPISVLGGRLGPAE